MFLLTADQSVTLGLHSAEVEMHFGTAQISFQKFQLNFLHFYSITGQSSWSLPQYPGIREDTRLPESGWTMITSISNKSIRISP